MKNLPLEKLVLEKSDKKQIREFLESVGRWKNISSGYSFFYKCLREAKNEENMLDDLIDFPEIDSEEFQKAIDKTEKIIQEDKEEKTTDKLGKNRETFNPHIELIYKSKGSGMDWEYGFRAFRKKTLEEGLDKEIQKILNKIGFPSSSLLTNEGHRMLRNALKEIGKLIEHHYLHNFGNPSVEIEGYYFYPTFESTAYFQRSPGRVEYNCSGSIVEIKE